MIAKCLVVALVLVQIPVTQVQAASNLNLTVKVLEDLRKPYKPPEFPDRTNEYKAMIAEKEKALEEAKISTLKASQEAEAAQVAQVIAQRGNGGSTPSRIAQTAPLEEDLPPSGLMGSMGYALAGGNCVNQVPMNLRAPGNPIEWPVLTMQPYIGGAALFPYNHVGRINGIWSNGDLEIAHENCPRCPTRYSPGSFRGFR